MSNTSTPKQSIQSISILMPAYKAMDTIEFALASIQHSTMPLEVIIAPDDGSYEYAKRFGHFANVCVLEPTMRVGVAEGRNRAFRASQGEWITTMDADDYVSHLYFDNLLQTALNTHQKCAFSVTAYTYDRTDEPTIIRQSPQFGYMDIIAYGDFCGSING